MTALPLPPNTRTVGTGDPAGDMDKIVSIIGALLNLAVDGTGSWATPTALGTAAYSATTAFDAAGAAATAQSTAETYAAGLVSPLLQLQATTGISGVALANGTPTITSWTAPSDGNMHRFMAISSLHVTSAETGGLVNVTWTAPGGAAGSASLMNSNLGTGLWYDSAPLLLAPGATVSIVQASALTAGAATIWAEIWAS